MNSNEHSFQIHIDAIDITIYSYLFSSAILLSIQVVDVTHQNGYNLAVIN